MGETLKLIDCLKQMTWRARVLRVLLELKWWIKPWVRPQPESFSAMRARQDKEVFDFQKRCKHKEVSFRYSPFVVCINCQKVLRNATNEEQERESKIFLAELQEMMSENENQLKEVK